jgi:DNA-binding beta-propeller fold protein YncE
MKTLWLSSCTLALLAVLCGATAHAATTYHLAKTIPLPGNTGWDGLYADAIGRRLYITRGTSVQVIDTKKDQLIGRIDGFVGNHGVTVDHRSGRGFISDGAGNAVTIFDLTDLTRIGEPVHVGRGPDCIVLDPATERVFTFNVRSNDSTVIDAVSGDVVGTIKLPGVPGFAVADGRGHIYDNIEDKDEIVSIDAQSLRIDNTWSIAPGRIPLGIAMDLKNRRLFSMCGNQLMIVSDPDAGVLATTAPIGSGFDAAAFDPKHEEVFVPSADDGTVTIFDEVTPNIYAEVAAVRTQKGARTIALDERTHVVYAVAATMEASPDPPATGKTTMQVVAGSVVVLVLEPDGR